METVDVLMKMPKVEGYEYTGEWRHVSEGDWFLSDATGGPREANVMCHPSSPRPILRKAEVWKPLTLEKALEMGKTRGQYKFRLCAVKIGYVPPVDSAFVTTVDYIDLKQNALSNVRLGHYGWVSNRDVAYLET